MVSVEMAVKVTMEDMLPNTALDIVGALRREGYVQGMHFDFEYIPPKADPVSGHWVDSKRYTIFTFYVDSLATWFTLKYG
jgi:hypothetical protein